MDPIITVIGQVSWVSDYEDRFVIKGFGLVYLSKGDPCPLKGHLVKVSLRSWHKKKEDGSYLNRLYVKELSDAT